jgi:hypothetical protein
MEPEGLLPHLQQPATCPYPDPHRSSPCHLSPHPTCRRFILRLSFRLLLGLSSGRLPSDFPTKTFYALDMCYSMHFYKILVIVPTNAQLVLLCTVRLHVSTFIGHYQGRYLQTHTTQHAQPRYTLRLTLHYMYV